MRSFSRLKALCSHPELLDNKPSKRRDEAAATGTLFHKYCEAWRHCLVEGKTWHTDGAPEPVRGWLRRMREVWTPPPGLEVEVAMGLEDLPTPRYVPVTEPKPHEYAAADGKTPLLTAGRADLIWPAPSNSGINGIHVIDIKTGQFYLGDPKRLRQLLAQGIAATLRANADGFIPGVYYARLGLFDRGDNEPIWRGSPEWNQAWAEVVASAKMPSAPNPGAWCLGCWSKADCSAYPGAVAA